MMEKDVSSSPEETKSHESEVQITIEEEGQISAEPEVTLRNNPRIDRVPYIFRQENEAAYTPRVISIGPIHHGNQNLLTIERYKQRYLVQFCRRLDLPEEEFHERMNDLVYYSKQQIREFYGEDVMTDEYMSNAIVYDAIFIIELFLRFTSYDKSQFEDDFILGQPWLRTAIAQDLILIENQLPFFFLEEIYELRRDSLLLYDTVKKPRPAIPSFLELATKFFSFYRPRKNVSMEQIMPLHLTDLVRRYWCLEHPPQHKAIRSLYRLTKLREAGLLIKPRQNACLLDIHFNRGTLEFPTSFTEGRNRYLSIISHFLFVGHLRRASLQIPPLEIDDNTETVLQNLVAFEQFHYPYEAYICNYIILLDFLITSPEDADLLIEKNVIVNSLGSGAAVAEMVKRLSKQIVVVNSCYYPLAQMLNEHYDSYRIHPVTRTIKAWFIFVKTFFPALVVAQLCVVILMLYLYRR